MNDPDDPDDETFDLIDANQWTDTIKYVAALAQTMFVGKHVAIEFLKDGKSWLPDVGFHFTGLFVGVANAQTTDPVFVLIVNGALRAVNTLDVVCMTSNGGGEFLMLRQRGGAWPPMKLLCSTFGDAGPDTVVDDATHQLVARKDQRP